MRELFYVVLDVFTDRRFGGNQLAVFPDGDDIPAETMQAIARELNLSETVFLSPAGPEGEWRARIFTPAVELPFAGHPTVGAAVALSLLGRVEGQALVLHEGVGPVPVRLTVGGDASHAMLTAPRLPERVAVAPAAPEALADVVGLSVGQLGPIAPAAYSAGVPFTFIPVKDLAALDAAAIDVQKWRIHIADTEAPHLVIFTVDDWSDGAEVAMRMFAPAMGITEDPATGAAAAALAGLLGSLQSPTRPSRRWRIAQGVKMGRPSLITLEAAFTDGAITAVRVGGQAVLVSRATMIID